MDERIERVNRRDFLKRSAKAAGGFIAVPPLVTGCAGEENRETDAADTTAISPGTNGESVSENEWMTLFDGESLDGWHTNRERIGHGTGGQWKVENGAIVGQQDPPGSGNGGILLTDHQFGDFELVIQMKPDWGVDTGLFLRSTARGQCLQMMVDYYDGGNIGHIYGEGLSGFNTRPFSINGEIGNDGKLSGFVTEPFEGYDQNPLSYTCTPEEWKEAWNIGDWNTARVRCKGKYPTITTWLNKVKVCEFNGATYEHPQYDRENVFQTLGRQGHIAIQVHGGQGWPEGARCRWRNVKIRPLEA